MKLELDTPEKPEILYMSGLLSMDPEKVFCKLFKVWRWFDKHTENGNALGVTYSFIDSHVSHVGFAEAMALSGWLRQDGNVLVLPNFDRHNGKTAKNRAVTNERVAKHRVKSNADVTLNVTPPPLQKPLPEKRREEETTPPLAVVEDLKTITWRNGVSLLISTGVPEQSARSFFGRLANLHPVEAIAEAIEAAIDSGAVNPKAYIHGCLGNKGGGARPNGQFKVAV